MSEHWRSLPDRVLEQLSAYADGELAPAESRQIEQQLEAEPAYREALQMFRQTRELLGEMPNVKAPRSYVLSEEIAGIRREWSWFPSRQLVTALTALMLVIVVGVDVLTSGPMQADLMAEPDLRVEAPPAADQIEVTAELQVMEEAEADPAAAQEAHEPTETLQVQGTGTPAGEAAGAFSAPTEADEEGFRLGDEPREMPKESGVKTSRLATFFAERPVLRALEVLIGAVFLLLVGSLLLRP